MLTFDNCTCCSGSIDRFSTVRHVRLPHRNHAVADHLHDLHVVLVEHLDAALVEAERGVGLAPALFEHFGFAAERVAGVDRADPAQIVDPGGAEAGFLPLRSKRSLSCDLHPRR